MVSIKTKVTSLISMIILLVVGIYGGVMLYQDRQEQTDELYRNAYAYAELVSQRMIENFRTNYENGNFVRFKTTLIEELEKNTAISNVTIASYNGAVLFAYLDEQDRMYEGDERMVTATMKPQVQASFPSVTTAGGRVLYIVERDGEMGYADVYGAPLPLSEWVQRGERVVQIAYPLKGRLDDHRYTVIYEISYDVLAERLWDRAVQTGLLTLLFIIGGLAVGYVFALRIVAPILRLSKDALAIARGALGAQVEIHTNDEVGVLANSFNKMSKDLQSTTEALISRERLAKEVELASRIQREFVPEHVPIIGNIDVAASVKPADAVGGDCYDFIPLDEHRMLFFIGDVTGHGVSAGLITAIANSIVYSLAHNPDVSTKDIAVNLNRVLRAKTGAGMFITMFIGLWDSRTGLIRYTPAGHEPTYHYNGATKELQQLKKEGIALGFLDDISMIAQEQEMTLEPGDTLVFYSDGIPEAWAPGRVMYDFPRFEESMRRRLEATSAKEAHDGILKDVYDFMAGEEQKDDVTLIVFRHNKKGE